MKHFIFFLGTMFCCNLQSQSSSCFECFEDTVGFNSCDLTTYVNSPGLIPVPGFNSTQFTRLGQAFTEWGGNYNWDLGSIKLSGISFLAENIEQNGAADNLIVEIRALDGGSYCAGQCPGVTVDSTPGTLLYSQTVPVNAISWNPSTNMASINFPSTFQVPASCDFAVILNCVQMGDDTIVPYVCPDTFWGFGPTALVVGSGGPCANNWQTVESRLCMTTGESAIFLHVLQEALLSNVIATTPTTCPGNSNTVSMNITWSGDAIGLPAPSLNYAWSPIPISSTSNSATYAPASTVTVTCSANTNCAELIQASNTISVISVPYISAGNDTTFCLGGTALLNPTVVGSYISSMWIGSNIANPFAQNTTATPSTSGYYWFRITDSAGCIVRDTLLVTVLEPVNQSLCLVTTDSVTGNHNVIIWEKPISYDNLDSFRIYREITLNNYQIIGTVHADSLSIFEDYSANPNTTNYRYKITARDTCNNEGNISPYHNTIHLQYLGFGNFQWTSYEIESMSNPVSSYNFYRDDLGNGNFQLIQVVPGSNNTYTDVNYSSYPNASYRVDVNWLSPVACTPTRTVLTSQSNIYSLLTVGTTEQQLVRATINVFPNPAGSVLNINSSENDFTIEIFDNTGRLIHSQLSEANHCVVSTSEFCSGFYCLKYTSANSVYLRKVQIVK